ncbi:BFD-like [2Fe-2S] binding domain protein [Mycobacterium xenopi 4042]|uniref:BFD-like [2Fe-2S] binding domain protein n=1 Tax=Mycobacterium xenopi 4042 TaxID=1299334 RepID=X8AH04_MYCXE|nr:BFD-like [2Fe-2S] binding domain protein [Mycobacterium xenopi 4042]
MADAVANGASTTKKVAEVCGAGAECGRCRHTVRAMITSSRTGCEAQQR